VSSPNLHDVLANVRRGRVTYLDLAHEQRRDLRDPDGQLALHILRHLLGARAATGTDHDRFPITMLAFQAVARKLGHDIGQKRSYHLIHRLIEAEVLNPSGSYRQRYSNITPTGFRVRLWRICRVASRLLVQPPVGTRTRSRGRFRSRWWEHELFGDGSGRPPPGIRKRDAARMRSPDEVECPWAYGLAFTCR
jgi:hypothetical protein